MGVAVKLIVHIFIQSGPIFIAAVEITIGLVKTTNSCIDLYTFFIHQNFLMCFIVSMSIIYHIQPSLSAYMAYINM